MSNFIYKLSEDSDFLMHHGIKGQKWGVENGPPYPLAEGKKSRTEKKAEKVKDKVIDKSMNAAMYTMQIPSWAGDWANGYRTVGTLAQAIGGARIAENTAKSYRDYAVKHYPKKASDYNEYIDGIKKSTDQLLSIIDGFKKSSDIDETIEKEFNKYEKKLERAEALSAVTGAVAATLGGIGGFYLGGPAVGIIGGGILGGSANTITRAAIQNDAEKKLQAYIDSKYQIEDKQRDGS